MMTGNDKAWHLDKRVPLGIIGALIVQTSALLYADATWRAETDGRIGTLEATVADNVTMRRKQSDRLASVDEQQRVLVGKLIGLDERTRAIAQQNDRILGLMLREADGSRRAKRGLP